MHKNCLRFSKPALAVLFALLTLCTSIRADQPATWISRGPGGGGALFAPSFSPHNPSELYIACDLGGFYRSTNLGASWKVLDFHQIQGNRNAQVQFTNNPLVCYSLDYTNTDGSDPVTPSKSTDGGLTWKRLINDPTFGGAYTLFADPANENNLIVSDYSHLYFSSNGGASFGLKFTASGGNGCHVAGAFFDGASIYAGTNAGLLVSTNSGSTFALSSAGGIASTQAMYSFAGARQGATVRLFCITLDTSDVYPGLLIEGAYSSYKSVYSIDVGQANWTARVTGIAANNYPVFVSLAANNISTVYVAGQDSNEFPVIYKSTNGGANWQSVLLTTNNQNIITGWDGHGGDRGWTYGAGALGFAVAVNDSNKAAFTDLGFSHITTDGGATWRQMYVDPADQNPMNAATPKNKSYHGIGLEDTSCWWMTWADSDNIFASYTDIRGTRSTDGGSSWSFNYTGQPLNSTYQSLRHPSNGNLYVATSSVHDMYQSTYLTDARIDGGSGAIKYSSDKGATWLTLHDFGHPVICLAIDPNNTNRMYASVIHSTQGGIYVSSNIQNGAASTWTKLTNPPRTEGHPFNIQVLNDGTLVCTYSGRRNSAGTFTASSGVFTSTNGGSSWTDRSASGMLYWTRDIVVDPHDASQSTWYVAVFSGWGGPPNGLGGLYKTTNRGVSWTRINSLDRVASCAINPMDPAEMYLTTEENGLWYTSNLTAVAPDFTSVTSYPFRQPERVFYNPYNANEIWVTSFGYGICVGTVATCDFSLTPTSNFFPESGGVGSLMIQAPSGCNWTAASDSNWLTITSTASGSGNGSVSYAVAQNMTGISRKAMLTVGGQICVVVQDGGASSGCRYSIFASYGTFSAGGGGANLNVKTESRCAWMVQSNAAWIVITTDGINIGNGTVSFTVMPNTSGASRTGTITIAGRTFMVRQKRG